MSGEHLDLTSEPHGGAHPRASLPASASKHAPANSGARKFIGVQFSCCDVYARVYMTRDETAYHGNCPRCAKAVHFKIGPGGTDARFFTVG